MIKDQFSYFHWWNRSITIQTRIPLKLVVVRFVSSWATLSIYFFFLHIRFLSKLCECHFLAKPFLCVNKHIWVFHTKSNLYCLLIR